MPKSYSPDVVEEQRMRSPNENLSSLTTHDPMTTATTIPHCSRRSIFHSYWQKKSTTKSPFVVPLNSPIDYITTNTTDSLRRDGGGGRGRGKRSLKLEPSYLGVYSFVPLKPKPYHQPPPGLTPIGSTDSIFVPSPPPQSSLISILRSYHGSNRRVESSGTSSQSGISDSFVRQSSLSSSSIKSSHREQCMIPLPFPDDATSESLVHFDPKITVHESVVELNRSSSGNWFSENELRSFLHETMNICRSSAVNAHKSYCPPEVKKAYDAAHRVGIKRPVLSSTCSTHRALFAEEILLATDEDAIVHDGSLKFFQLMKEEVKRVLIVDNSLSSRKLLRRHILSMFPHAHIDLASSGEDALVYIDYCYDLGCINYDIIVAEENLQQSDDDATTDNSTLLDLTGSELLRLLNEMEVNAAIKPETCDKSMKLDSRQSLKIGVSVSLGKDCGTLRNRGGADIFWSKPPPKSSYLLRNQILNALLSKRGSSIFICGC